MCNNKKILTGLDSITYEHPFDREALKKLNKTPGIVPVSKFIVENAVEKVYSIQYTGSHVRVTSKSYPQIYNYLLEACKILDIETIPEMYIKWDCSIDAQTVGADHPIVILNSGLIDNCTDDEILFLIGHELGHIKSNHMLYHMMCDVVTYILDIVPGVNMLAKPLILAAYYWDRMSDLTADRAGLLCCQNRDAMISSLMKMAGVPIKEYNNMDVESFLEQAKEFDKMSDDFTGAAISTYSIATSNEPWTVRRAAELLKWIESGDYEKYLNESL